MTPAARRQTRLRVTVTDARGRPLTSSPAAGLGPWLASVAPASARGAVSIAIVSDRVMQRMNREYRGKNTPTDVLSFPPGSPRGIDGARTLGDLAIARGVAARQARALGHAVRIELRILALHGLLHLLGYDHETDRGAMGRVEERLRKRAKLPSGLIGRR